MKKMLLAAVLSLAPVTATIAADYIDLQVDRTARNIAGIESYQGVIRQRGLYGDSALVSEVSFRRPHEFQARVTAPADLAGTLMVYHGDTLTTWWPKQELALVIRHFTPPAAAGEEQRIADAFRQNLENYLYGLGQVREVAGMLTVQVDQRARRDSQLVQSAMTRVYDDLSFPLSGQVTVRGGAKLDYHWDSIRFNDPEPAALPPPPELPASTLVMNWDLAWPARSAQDAAARLPKAVPFPDTFGGLARDRLLVHPEALPAIGGWYRDDNYYLLITASRDTGWNPFAAEYGMRVPFGGTHARVVLSPLNNSWSFRRDGVLYSVLTNLHAEVAYRELLAQFAPPAATPVKAGQKTGQKPAPKTNQNTDKKPETKTP